jgi:(S)-ureidoglycine aminohydrolase
MHSLGQTRSKLQSDHLIQTPDTFVRAPLPGMAGGVAIILAAPAAGAGFVEYTAELEAGGRLGPANAQRFLYVLSGEVELAMEASKHRMKAGGFAYLPAGEAHELTARNGCSLVVIEKRYLAEDGVTPAKAFVGHEAEIAGVPLDGDEDLAVRSLIRDAMAHDFAVNTMTFQPGASLSRVEVHVMEHGLLMLEGGGIYRLGESWYPVAAGDFIWMAPYCPQWFGAFGKTPAKYLIYKDWNRHPLPGGTR